ncbi:hypothetical protein ACIGJO_35160 [Streptomyces sp. NPDC079020]
MTATGAGPSVTGGGDTPVRSGSVHRSGAVMAAGVNAVVAAGRAGLGRR